MAVFKCKMCGGQLEISENMSICECEYCGTQQTLPKSDDEQTLNLINRANHFRQQCEFDKAAQIYERLITQKENDSELYWSLVLCRYGIEYVDDPVTKKKIATCHRTQFKSILDDADYLSAISYADFMQKPVYEEEAKYIDTVQKGILEISNKEEPFDVFICYKESDEAGRRTPDSVLAQDLYYQLTREGFKVFFSRITLENKLGTAYEPYIFAALNSAKVMVVVGTKPEYYNAVWVKNEWSRYLMLMQEDRSRTIIPAYKDMDPYDLPDALSMFQAQDMSKLGFMQDLIHGINKIVKDEPVESQVIQQTLIQNVGETNTEPLLKRARMFLEDEDWNSANEYCNRVLDINPECGQAYYYLLMAKLQVRTDQEFESMQSSEGIMEEAFYTKSYRFADDSLKAKLDELNQKIIYNYAERQFHSAVTNGEYLDAQTVYMTIRDYKDSEDKIKLCEQNALQYRYDEAVRAMDRASTFETCKAVGRQFAALGDFKDSRQKAEECEQKAERAIEIQRKEKIYNRERHAGDSSDIHILEAAIHNLEAISDYKDATQIIKRCQGRIETIKEQELWEQNQRKKRKIKISVTLGFLVLIIICFVTVNVTVKIIMKNRYNGAVSAYESGEYDTAYDKFAGLHGYKDSEIYINKMSYRNAELGDIVSFGDYEWYVIRKTDSICTLLCVDSVKTMQFDDGDASWESCEIREWLNDDFYNSFSDEDKAIMALTNVETAGETTKDFIYLLDIVEADELNKTILGEVERWWLRSPDGERKYAANVYDGKIVYGYEESYFSVRPVINIAFE